MPHPPPFTAHQVLQADKNTLSGRAIEVHGKLQQLHDVALKVTTKVQWGKGRMVHLGEFQNTSPKCLNLESWIHT